MFGSVAAIALYLLDTGTYSDPGRRSATPPSTPSRSPPPPASPAPTTPSGRSSRRCGCCSCAASSPAPDRPAAASDDARDHPLQKRVFRELMRSLHPPRRRPDQVRQRCGGQPDHLRGAGLRFPWHGGARQPDPADGVYRTRPDHRLLRGRRLRGSTPVPGSAGSARPPPTRCSATSRPGSAPSAMLLGRLEIFTLLVVLGPYFWRK